MTVPEKLRMIAECVRALQGGEWSVREVLILARTAGLQVRQKTAYEILYNLDLPGRKARPGPRNRTPWVAISDSKEIATGTPSGSDLGSDPQREAISPQGSLSPTPPISPNPSLFSLTSFGTAPPKNGTEIATRSSRKSLPKKAREVDTSWIAPLEEQARALFVRRLDSFTKDERNIAGRYHALHFSNCNREAIHNKEIGRRIAASFADMGSDLKWGDMTFGEYVGYAKDTHVQCDGKPWYNPWLIKAVVEFEPVHKR